MNNKVIDDLVNKMKFNNAKDEIKDLLTTILGTNEIVTKLLNIITKLSSKENVIYPAKLHNMDFYFYDSIISNTVDIVKNEIDSYYNFDSIDFKEGDIVIDIGANVGIVSIYLAKRYPFLKIYSFEPVKQNYDNLIKNIELNKIEKGIITAENVAITKDRREIDIVTPVYNTGASSGVFKGRDLNIFNSNTFIHIPSITFDDIFSKYKIEKCKLLKIDREGAEYEILYNANTDNLKKCEIMKLEFHPIDLNIDANDKEINRINELYKYCSQYIKHID